jgi:hypothetical protein
VSDWASDRAAKAKVAVRQNIVRIVLINFIGYLIFAGTPLFGDMLPEYP